jgi:hypothetical protein
VVLCDHFSSRAVSKLFVNILSVHWDFIAISKMLSRAARLYAFFFLISSGYLGYSLARVFVVLCISREKAVLARLERRIANARQIILLLLFLFGIIVANEVFSWSRVIRLLQSPCGDCAGDPFGILGALAFAVFAILALLHTFQWIASVWIQRRVDLSG